MLGGLLFTTALALAPPSSCDAGTNNRIEVTLKLEVLRAKSVPPQVVTQTLEEARTIFARYGIKLDLVKTIDVDDASPFGTGDRPRSAPADAAAAAQRSLDLATEPARTLVQEAVSRRNGHVFVLMTSKLAPPDSVIRRAAGNLRALTLVDNGDSLSKAVGMKGRAPLVLLGMAEGEPATGRTLAHELGHVVGLAHREEKGALMRPHDDNCPVGMRMNELRAFERFAELCARQTEKPLETDAVRPLP